MEKKNKKKKLVIIIIIIAVILIITGILLAIFVKKDNKEEIVYYATFMVDGEQYGQIVEMNNGYISKLPTSPKKEGYIFAYWKVGIMQYTGKEKFHSDITLNAVFNEKTKFKVTFVKDNGEKNVVKEVYEKDKVTKITDPKKVGNDFIGWYHEGFNSLFSFEESIYEDTTLIAKWEPYVYIITFDSNGGTPVSSKVVDYKNKVKTPANPTKEGYNFLGWYLNDKKYDFNTTITKDMTLVAKWEVISYTVKFDSAGGSNIESQKVPNGNLVKVPVNPKREGYKFIDWTLDGNVFDFTAKVTKDITLIAKWEKIEEKIAYGDVNEDGKIDNQDSIKLQKHLSGEETLNTQQTKNADVNGDGSINSTDYDLLEKYISEHSDGAIPSGPLS